jgi:putative sigma-54 modulation protein
MRVDLTGRQVEITPALRALVIRKLAKLDRLLNNRAVSAQVVLSLQKHRHVSDITLHTRGDHILHGLGEASGWQGSLTSAVDKLVQQAHKLKDRWTRRRRGTSARRGQAASPGRAEGVPRARLVRVKPEEAKPMSLDDALLYFENSPEPVLVFRNADSDTLNVLYRRPDGRLGLVEPEA